MKIFFAGILSLMFVSTGSAEFLTRREATVAAIDAKGKGATFLVEPKARTAKAQQVKHTLYFTGERVFRQLPSRRKVQATVADLRIGQRVLLSGVSSISSSLATEVIILPAKSK